MKAYKFIVIGLAEDDTPFPNKHDLIGAMADWDSAIFWTIEEVHEQDVFLYNKTQGDTTD
jgi:hypothetical protein